MEGGGWRVESGGLRVEGGWRVAGGWRVVGGWWRVVGGEGGETMEQNTLCPPPPDTQMTEDSKRSRVIRSW